MGTNCFQRFLIIRMAIVAGVVVFCLRVGYTQPVPETADHNRMRGTHRLSLMLGHTHISKGVQADGRRQWLALAAWGLKYDYWLSDRWAVGLHTDVILETFAVEEHLRSDAGVLERRYPVGLAGVGTYKPTQHSSFLFGAGGEFAQTGTLFLNRLGYEWGTHLPKQWELSVEVAYDFRWGAYDSWTLAIGISKLLRANPRAGNP